MTNGTEYKGFSNKAMLVSLSISHWKPTAKSVKLAQESANANGVDSERIRVTKRLFAGVSACEAIQDSISKAWKRHYALTLPWTWKGWALLPTTHFYEYMEGDQDDGEAFRTAVSEFLGLYESLILDDEKNATGIFDRSDYPSLPDMRRKFKYDMEETTLPSFGPDIRLDMSQDEIDRISDHMRQKHETAFQQAGAALHGRIVEAVERLHKNASEFARDPETGKLTGKRFADTAIINLRELVGLLPGLNLGNDPELARIGREIENRLCSVEPGEIRESELVKETIITDTDDILKQLGGLAG